MHIKETISFKKITNRRDFPIQQDNTEMHFQA